ncbi:MAG: T9SS type A sorting domain-containing protein [Flavobacteriales bacterium]
MHLLLAHAQSPGGVNGRFLWLKTSGDSLQFVNENYFNASFQPEENQLITINYQGNKNLKSLSGINIYEGQFNHMTAFAIHSKSFQERPVWSINKGDSALCVMSTKRLARLTDIKYFNHSSVSEAPFILSSYFHETDGFQNDDYTIQLGNYDAIPNLPLSSGELVIPEIILFDRVLAPKEIAKVETYLALKYGLTRNSNYIGTTDEILWNNFVDHNYSHNIFGIGSDDIENLHLYKSSSINEPGFLSLSIDSAAQIPTGNFLIAGDNGKLKKWGEKTNWQPQMLERNWKWRSNGHFNEPIRITLSYNLIQGEPIIKDSFWLLVDQSGSGQFNINETEYYKGEMEGQHVLFNVPADDDTSGSDMFALAAAGEIIQKIAVKNPTCDSIYSGEISIGVEGGSPPYQFNVRFVEGTFSRKWMTDDNEMRSFSSLTAGEYVISIQDHNGNSIVESVYLEASDSPKCLLDENYELLAQEKLILDASIEDCTCTYLWECNGFIVSHSSSIEIIETGEYILSIERDGCRSRKKIMVTTQSASSIIMSALPNPSISGYTNIRIAASSTDPIEIHCYDSGGRHLSSKTLSGKFLYSYLQFFETSGLYVLKAFQNGTEASIKIEIQ